MYHQGLDVGLEEVQKSGSSFVRCLIRSKCSHGKFVIFTIQSKCASRSTPPSHMEGPGPEGEGGQVLFAEQCQQEWSASHSKKYFPVMFLFSRRDEYVQIRVGRTKPFDFQAK